MIVLLDTSTPDCRLYLYTDDKSVAYEWLAERNLAHGLHKYIADKLKENGASLADIKGLGVFEGPGSFTGLRIGISVFNSLASGLDVPIVGARGDDWKEEATKKLKNNQNEKVVLPFYGSEARITAPKK